MKGVGFMVETGKGVDDVGTLAGINVFGGECSSIFTVDGPVGKIAHDLVLLVGFCGKKIGF